MLQHNNQTRAPKLIGDFGEGLVTYALIRGGYEVAHVDHVGADLIAEKNGERIAVSVKTRNRNTDTKESEMVVISDDNIKKLKFFSEQFGMSPVFAQIICHSKINTIHLFMIRVSDIEANMKKSDLGYSLYFSLRKIDATKSILGMKYSCWSNELIDVI
jgi:Holliday junction resolvase